LSSAVCAAVNPISACGYTCEDEKY
jgi:hypothetical protein